MNVGELMASAIVSMVIQMPEVNIQDRAVLQWEAQKLVNHNFQGEYLDKMINIESYVLEVLRFSPPAQFVVCRANQKECCFF